jgi:Ca-activated chloride channel family protein
MTSSGIRTSRPARSAPGTAVTALYVVRLRDDLVDAGSLGAVRLRWTEPGDRDEARLTEAIGTGRLARSFESADPTFQLDAIVAATAEVLRESPYAEGYDLRDVVDIALAESENLPHTDQVHEFLDFVEALDEMVD